MTQDHSEAEALLQLTSELDRETDRALAIITSAHLDDLLEHLIALTLKISTPEVHKLVFNGDNAPLGTFSAKIEYVKVSQLLSSDEARDLTLMRKIRNDFAHELIGISFETSNVKDRCAELRTAQIGGDPGTARERFKKAAIRLIVDITLKIKGSVEGLSSD